jgi:hypothetical protein
MRIIYQIFANVLEVLVFAVGAAVMIYAASALL